MYPKRERTLRWTLAASHHPKKNMLVTSSTLENTCRGMNLARTNLSWHFLDQNVLFWQNCYVLSLTPTQNGCFCPWTLLETNIFFSGGNFFVIRPCSESSHCNFSSKNGNFQENFPCILGFMSFPSYECVIMPLNIKLNLQFCLHTPLIILQFCQLWTQTSSQNFAKNVRDGLIHLHVFSRVLLASSCPKKEICFHIWQGCASARCLMWLCRLHPPVSKSLNL